MLPVWVALAAGAGAVARYLVDHAVRRPGFPLGTLVVNVSGSFVLGVVVGSLSGQAAVVLGAGFAGGYTTLSTFAWETLALTSERDALGATVNVVGSVALGLVAACLGVAAAG